MKKVLPNTEKTRKYLEKLPKIYLIACWAGFGVREFPYAGKCDLDGIPYVYDYCDCNGTCDEYRLTKLNYITTGWIYGWSTIACRAKELARLANKANGEEWRNEHISVESEPDWK